MARRVTTTAGTIFLMVLCRAPLPAPASQPAATTYYVAMSGDDAWPGTQTRPWRTIQRAADTMVAGDTVLIAEGTYEEEVAPRHSGSAGKMISYKARPGDTVVINVAESRFPFTIEGKHHLRVEGLQTKGGQFGMLLKNASDIEMSALTLGGCTWDCIEVIGASARVLIEGCQLGPSAKGAGADVATHEIRGRPHDVTIRDCAVHDCPFAGLDSEMADRVVYEGNIIWNTAGCGIDAGSGDDNVVRDNVIHHCNTGIALSSNENSVVSGNVVHDIYDEAFYSFPFVRHGEAHAGNVWHSNVVYNAGFALFESDTRKGAVGRSAGHRYYNNLFYNIGTHGKYRPPFWIEGVRNVQFYNNTLCLNDNYDGLVIAKGGSGGATGARVFNNIIAVSTDDDAVQPVRIDAASAVRSAIDYNCCWNRRGREISGAGAHTIVADPRFVNVEAGDFHLGPASPCVDAGAERPDGATAPQRDLDGNPRPQGRGWDVGCYESERVQPARSPSQ
jgi:parallel beta-helix repeat protein